MKIKSFSVIGKQVGVRLGASGEVSLVDGSLVIEGERGSYLLNYPGHKSIPDLMQAFRTDLMGIMDMTEDELASAVESVRDGLRKVRAETVHKELGEWQNPNSFDHPDPSHD